MLTWVELNYIIMKIMENKQTAVEWLVEKLLGTGCLTQKPESSSINGLKVLKVLNQAKAMEKEQIIDSFDEGKSDGYKTAKEWDEMIIWLSAEQYYTETYGK